MLILPKLQLPFDNLQQLLDSKIETYVPRGSALMQTIQESSSNSGLYRLKNQLSSEANPFKASDLLVRGSIAGFTSEQLLLYIMHDIYRKTKTCPLYLASQKFFEATSIGLGFPKGSPLRDKINPIIYNLKEFGILDHLFKRRIKDAYLCLIKESLGTDALRPLDVGDFYGVFCVYLGGIVTAVIAFIFEVIIRRKNHAE
ncbi:glutamate receptor 1-like [Macrobrachium nipponense]|uniref:glutamate receptor 1-like n=1 Tax=Macrobrachium nipponense TaxID=159736 RepID=UPI0030C83337